MPVSLNTCQKYEIESKPHFRFAKEMIFTCENVYFDCLDIAV